METRAETKLTHELYTAKEAASVLRCPLRRIGDYVRSGKIAGAAKFCGKWIIPASSLKPLLADISTVRIPSEVPEYRVSQACKKLDAIREFQKLKVIKARQCHSSVLAEEQAALVVRVPLRTIQRWLSKYNRQGLIGLVDKRGTEGVSTSKKP